MNSKSATRGHGTEDKLLDTNVVLPEMILTTIKENKVYVEILLSRLTSLNKAFTEKKVNSILDTISFFDTKVDEFESYIEKIETEMHLQLNNCHVAFDVDPHLVEKISNRLLSQSAFDRYDPSFCFVWFDFLLFISIDLIS